MARCASGSALGSGFDAFLFASVREERGGSLSVLSALARLDLDPWREAAGLARLPRAAAIDRLALLLAGSPGGPAHPEADEVAARLVAFLPDAAGSRISAPMAAYPPRAETPVLLSRFVILLYIVSMLVLLDAPGIDRGSRVAAQTSTAQAPTTGKPAALQGQKAAGR